MELVIEHLDNSVGWFRIDSPEDSNCCLIGTWYSDNINLYISFSITDQKVVSFYLEGERDPPHSEYVPLVNGVSIGTSEEELLLQWGPPISIETSEKWAGCTDISYNGIRFGIRNKDRLISFIEIPGTNH